MKVKRNVETNTAWAKWTLNCNRRYVKKCNDEVEWIDKQSRHWLQWDWAGLLYTDVWNKAKYPSRKHTSELNWPIRHWVEHSKITSTLYKCIRARESWFHWMNHHLTLIWLQSRVGARKEPNVYLYQPHSKLDRDFLHSWPSLNIRCSLGNLWKVRTTNSYSLLFLSIVFSRILTILDMPVYWWTMFNFTTQKK